MWILPARWSRKNSTRSLCQNWSISLLFSPPSILMHTCTLCTYFKTMLLTPPLCSLPGLSLRHPKPPLYPKKSDQQCWFKYPRKSLVSTVLCLYFFFSAVSIFLLFLFPFSFLSFLASFHWLLPSANTPIFHAYWYYCSPFSCINTCAASLPFTVSFKNLPRVITTDHRFHSNSASTNPSSVSTYSLNPVTFHGLSTEPFRYYKSIGLFSDSCAVILLIIS